MKAVTKQEFYKEIGCRDIVLNTIGNYPYTTEFKTRSGFLVGKSNNEGYFMSDSIYNVKKPR